MQRRDLLKFIAGIYGLYSIDLFARDKKTLKKDIQESKKEKKISSLKKSCFIGIGGGGTNIIEDISKLDNKHIFISMNSDKQSLEQKKSKHKILLGWNKNAGLGCGGKDTCGRNLITDDLKQSLEQLTKNINQIYVIATLGGGVGSGATPEIAEFLKSLDKQVVVFVTLPFNFEGKIRSNIAYKALEKIKLQTDGLIVLKNDDLINGYKNKSLGIKDTFKMASASIYKKVCNETSIKQT